MREIVLDTETTGLDPHAGHRIVEFGAVELVNGFPTGRILHHYINPERDVPPEVVRVHGLTNAFLADKPTFSEIADSIMDFLDEDQLVIHNAGFDMKFINAEFSWLGFPTIPMQRALDTVALARRKFPGSPASLDALCRRFNIDNSNRTFHGALLDAQLLAEVYLELTDRRQASLLDGAMPRVPKQSRTTSDTDHVGGGLRTQAAWPPRVFVPSNDELAAHAAFIATMKKTLWKS